MFYCLFFAGMYFLLSKYMEFAPKVVLFLLKFAVFGVIAVMLIVGCDNILNILMWILIFNAALLVVGILNKILQGIVEFIRKVF